MPVNFKNGGFYPHLFSYLPKNLLNQLNYLKTFFAPYSKRVYLVGGAVRDMVQKELNQRDITLKDMDIEVYGIEVKKFEKLMKELGAKGVGKSFFVYKWRENIDISLPRVESKVREGHRGFKVKVAKDEEEASIRRDFRMNALMLNIYSGELLDFWGGIEDIKNRKIRIINEKKFKEDSLRVLRGMQFSARFGYKIEKKSLEIMDKISLNDLSKERIFWEFEKMFKGSYPHYGVFALYRLDLDRKIFKTSFPSKSFLKTALELAKEKENFQKELYKFYFLYILGKNLHKPFSLFLEKLQAPKEYYKVFKFQKSLPKKRGDRFLAGLALKYPLSFWLGNYKKDVQQRAKELGIWEKRLEPIKPFHLLQEGFKGKELGEELRRRSLKFVRERFKV